ncbi:hypothetical protein AY599_23655 [Leptolyngbya valderiana BDU 20041]|nr:hypothetical protein AY599_23655 [Leptolyngbya valderiana BDU 20041]
MPVYRVFLNDVMPSGQRRFVNFECGHASLEDLHGALVDKGLAFGFRLITARSERAGDLEVVRRDDFVLGRDAVFSIDVPNVRFFQWEDG